MAISDEQLGRAIRTLASHVAADRKEGEFEFYAERLVSWANGYASGKYPKPEPIDRVYVRVHPMDQVDGLVEFLVEMVLGRPCGVSEYPVPRPNADIIREDLAYMVKDIERQQAELLRSVNRRLEAVGQLLRPEGQ